MTALTLPLNIFTTPEEALQYFNNTVIPFDQQLQRLITSDDDVLSIAVNVLYESDSYVNFYNVIDEWQFDPDAIHIEHVNELLERNYKRLIPLINLVNFIIEKQGE